MRKGINSFCANSYRYTWYLNYAHDSGQCIIVLLTQQAHDTLTSAKWMINQEIHQAIQNSSMD